MADYSTMSDAELLAAAGTTQTPNYATMSDADLLALAKPPAAPLEPSGFIPSNLRKGGQIAKQTFGGFQRFLGAETAGLETVREAEEEQQRLEAANPSTTWADVTGVGSGLKFVGENVLKALPLAVPSIAGAIGGAVAAPALGVTGLGATLLAGAGAALPSLGIETGIIASESDQVSGRRGDILKAAIPAAALDAASTVVTAGAAGILPKTAAAIAKGGSKGAQVAKGAVRVAEALGGEAATESAQSPLETWGAGKPVFKEGETYQDDIIKNTVGALSGGMVGGENYTPEMQKEMKESFFAGGAAGLGMAGGGKVISTGFKKLTTPKEVVEDVTANVTNPDVLLEETGTAAMAALEDLVDTKTESRTITEAVENVQKDVEASNDVLAEALNLEPQTNSLTLEEELEFDRLTNQPYANLSTEEKTRLLDLDAKSVGNLQTTPQELSPDLSTPVDNVVPTFNPAVVLIDVDEAHDYLKATGTESYEVYPVRNSYGKPKYGFIKTVAAMREEGFGLTPSGNPFDSQAAAAKRVGTSNFDIEPYKNKWVGSPKEPQNGVWAQDSLQLDTEPTAELATSSEPAPAGVTPLVPTKIEVVGEKSPQAVTPNQVKGSISVYNVDEVSALGYDADTGVYTLREKGPEGPVDVATYEVINGKIENFKTDATAQAGFDREQQIQEAQSLVEKIEAGRGAVKFAAKGLRDVDVRRGVDTPAKNMSGAGSSERENTADSAGLRSMDGLPRDSALLVDTRGVPLNRAATTGSDGAGSGGVAKDVGGVSHRLYQTETPADVARGVEVGGVENTQALSQSATSVVGQKMAGTQSASKKAPRKVVTEDVPSKPLTEKQLRSVLSSKTFKFTDADTVNVVAHRIAEAFGHKVQPYQETKLGADGFVSPQSPGIIYVNKNAKSSAVFLLGHELTHTLKTSYPELYNELWAYVESTTTPEKLMLRRDQMRKVTKLRENLSDAELNEEIVADLVGNEFQKPGFWDKMAEAEPTLFAKMINLVRVFVNFIKQNLGGNTEAIVADLKRLDAVTAAVFAKYAKLQNEGKFIGDVVGEQVKFADPTEKEGRIYEPEYLAAASRKLEAMFVRHGDTPFEKWSATDRLAALNYGHADAAGGLYPEGSYRESKNSALRDKLSKVAGVFGHDVTLLADFAGRGSYGFISEGDSKHIYIFDTKHSDQPLTVLGHELIHQMKRADEKLYKELGTEFVRLKDQSATDTYFNSLFKDKLTDKGVPASTSEEWVGDVFGLSMGRQGFWAEFEKAAPSLAARVANFMHKFIQKFKDRLFTARAGLAADSIKDFKAVDKIAADIAARYAQRLEKKAATGDVQAIKELSAWHGSPHDHDKFSTDKIGTGEGAQAYGYGLYFAGSRDVAEWYQEKLSRDRGNFTIGDLEKYIPNHIYRALTVSIKNNDLGNIKGQEAKDTILGILKSSLVSLEKRGKPADKEVVADYESVLELVRGVGKESVEVNPLRGRLYQVELAPNEDEYLLWDKPLSEQSEKVKEALESEIVRQREAFKTDPTNHGNAERLARLRQLIEAVSGERKMSGADMYHTLSSGFGAKPEQASEYLHSLGIRGIKYLDGTSRNKTAKVTRIWENENRPTAPQWRVSSQTGYTASFVTEEAAIEDAEKQNAEINQFNYVIFNDEDVSITMKFSAVDAAKSVNSFFKKAFTMDSLKTGLSDTYRYIFPQDRIIKSGLGSFKFKPIHKMLTVLADATNRMSGAATDILTPTHTHAEEFNKLFVSDEARTAAANLALKESIYQLDGDKPLKGQRDEKVWDAETKEWKIVNTFTPPGTVGFAEAKTLEEAYAEVRAARDAVKKMSPAHLAIIRKMQDNVAHAAQQRINALKERNDFLFGEGSKEAVKQNEELDNTARLAGRYMPLSRFGDFLVRVLDKPDGQQIRMESFKTRSASVEFVATMRAEGRHAVLEEKLDTHALDSGISAIFLDKIQKAAEANGLTGENLANFVEEYKKQWAATLPDSSLRANAIRRTNMAGFSTDLLRVYEDHMMKFANASPKIKYGVRVEQNFRNMRNAIKAEADKSDSDTAVIQDLYSLHNLLYERYRVGKGEQVNEVVKMLSKGVFLNFLASPSVYFVQWAQPFMLSLPKMLSRHGVKSISVFNRSVKETLAGRYSDKAIQDFDVAHGYMGQEVLDLMDAIKLEPDVAKAARMRKTLKKMYTDLPSDLERDLLAQKLMILRGGNDLAFSHDVVDDISEASKLDRAVNKVVEVGGYFMRKSETGSRRSTNIAAFRLEMARSGDVSLASDYAMKVVDETLFNFGSENRSALLQGNVGRVVGMFQYFRLHTIANEFQLAKDAIGREHQKAVDAAVKGGVMPIDQFSASKDGVTYKSTQDVTTLPEEVADYFDAIRRRSEARKEFAFQMGITFMFAGAAGTPLAMMTSNVVTDALWGALQMMFGDDDEPWDVKREFEMALQELIGGTATNVVTKGIFTLLGLDISKRIGMENMANLIGSDPPAGMTGTRKAEWTALRLLGPAAGAASDWFRAKEAFDEGDMGTAMQYMSPKILKDPLKAFDIANNGVSASGKTILKAEDVSMYDFALQFAGINPMDVSLARAESRYLKNISTELSQRRSMLIRHLAQATVEQDFEAKEQAIEKINAFSEKQPKLKISQQEVVQKIKKVRDAQSGKLSKREGLIQGEFGKK